MLCPGVSVVIPAHDAEATIRRAITSVQLQTVPVSEIVVVDDHSEDRTAQIVRALAAEDERIVLHPAERRGAGHARNLGVAAATGQVIAFLDADDVWYPEKLEAQLPLLTEDVAFVGALVHYLGEDGSVLGSYLPFDDWDEATASLRRAETMPVSLAFSIVRRADLLRLGGFDESFLRTQDLELGQRLVADGRRRIAWPCARALGGYVLHPGGVSARSYEEQFLAAELVRARVRGATDVSYEQWQLEPDLTPAARRALRSGRHYRLAAVAQGSGDRLGVLRHGVLATVHDPAAVVRKLRHRRRHTADLVPAGPPPEIVAAFHDEPLADVTQVPSAQVVGLELAEDPLLLAHAVVQDYLSSPRTMTVFAAHITSLNRAADREFVEAFNASDARHVDGVSWSLIARAGGDQARKVATSDLTPLLIESLSRGLGRPVRVAVLGGEPGDRAHPTGRDRGPSVASLAGQQLERDLPVQLVAAHHGFQRDWSACLAEIRERRPDVVLVGMGMPTEAFWVRDHLALLPSSVVVTCGGWLRLLAGLESRASGLLQRWGLEWLHRLTTTPRRTAGRYLVGTVNLARHGARAAATRVRNDD